MIRIIGIGSPFGDDAAGLETGRRLAIRPPARCEVLVADRPGAGLIELLDGASAVILIDAVGSGAPAGTIHDLPLDAIDELGGALVSSHGLGVAAAFALARKLGRAPSRGRLIGIEVSAERTSPLSELSPSVLKAIGGAAARVRHWVARL